MFETMKKLRYAARVLLARSGGQPEAVHVAGRPVSIMHAGEGPTFVYLHSALGESSMWLPFYQAWAKRFRILVPTHPGFGDGNLDGIDSIEDLAFHYVELFDALGLEQVILGGVSLGGWIAAEFAVRWPERVHKLWIADAPGLWVDDEPLPDLFRIVEDEVALRKLLFHDPNSYIARLVIEDNPDEERFLAGYRAMTTLARLVWERPYDPKLAGRLRRVQCPTLLVWGDDDRLVPPSYGKAYQAAIPKSEFKLVPKCGHLPMFEREAEFVETIANFCAR
jgi:pimeloyl-ACP methyl ester carboxylesterase